MQVDQLVKNAHHLSSVLDRHRRRGTLTGVTQGSQLGLID